MITTEHNPLELPLDELQQEHRVLQEFLHLAPVGLLRCDEQGEITVMNPMAAQLLGPLGLGRGELNLFNILEGLTQDIRLLVQTFSDTVGVICDNFRVMLPHNPKDDSAPIALGVTVMRVSARHDKLMVVLTDQSSAVKLQRLQGSFIR